MPAYRIHANKKLCGNFLIQRTYPVSPTVVGFNGKAVIIGGSGKFKRAVGEIDYDGTFDVANANSATYHAKGWISY